MLCVHKTLVTHGVVVVVVVVVGKGYGGVGGWKWQVGAHLIFSCNCWHQLFKYQ